MYRARALRLATVLLPSCLLLAHAACAWSAPVEPPALAGIPVDFILFTVTLVGIALFHHYTLPIAVGELIVTGYKVSARIVELTNAKNSNHVPLHAYP